MSATRALLAGSVLPVRQPTTLAPAAAGLLLPVLLVGALDSADALLVLRWTGVLLACVLVAALDDPSGEVTAASPYPPSVRVAARLAVAAAYAVPAWGLAALLVEWRQPWVPVLAVGLEALGTCLLGVALAAGLRAWRDLHRPSQVAAMLLLATVALLDAAPRWYDLHVTQVWGPPWEAAHLRWLAVALLGAAVLVAAVRDPLRSP